MGDERLLIMIPTYNEVGNITLLYKEIKALNLSADILIIDDNSSDGTRDKIEEIIDRDKTVFKLFRPAKLGIGNAHKAGIRWSVQQGYNHLITLDCDFTHPPEYIPDFLKLKANYDIVVGSRFMQKDSLEDWPVFRKILTHLGHWFTVNLLDMPFDASGAFRLYRLNNKIQLLKLIRSDSYSFFFESLFVFRLNKCSIVEIPIHLPARTMGKSKMTFQDAYKSIRFLLSLYIRKLTNKKSLILKEV
jgi:dolichol-phosphate mannosyltransferase